MSTWTGWDADAAARWGLRAAAGIRVDVPELDRRIVERERRRELDWRRLDVDPRSDDAPAQRWVKRLGVISREVGGNPAVDKAGLPRLKKEMRERATVPEDVRSIWAEYTEARSSAKSISALRSLRTAVQATGRVHPTIAVRGAVTGRFTMSGPNLQGLRTVDRDLLIADEGMVLIGIDWGQVEPRIAAWLSGDPAMIQAVQDDVYLPLAAAIGRDRAAAKGLMISSLYGEGVPAMAGRLGVGVEEARRVKTDLWGAWPVFGAWSQATAAARTPIRLYDGSLLPAPETHVRVNHSVQGSGAVLFKEASAHVDHQLHRVGMTSALWMPVHDELTVQVPVARAEEAAEILGRTFRAQLGPVAAEGKPVIFGSRWAHA